jgi:hypothetical protein
MMVVLEMNAACLAFGSAVVQVLPTVPLLNPVETLRTGQYAPPGWEMGSGTSLPLD